MREINRSTSERYGVSSLTLMANANAGAVVADFVTMNYPSARRIAVIAGKGNNGGDTAPLPRGICLLWENKSGFFYWRK